MTNRYSVRGKIFKGTELLLKAYRSWVAELPLVLWKKSIFNFKCNKTQTVYGFKTHPEIKYTQEIANTQYCIVIFTANQHKLEVYRFSLVFGIYKKKIH